MQTWPRSVTKTIISDITRQLEVFSLSQLYSVALLIPRSTLLWSQLKTNLDSNVVKLNLYIFGLDFVSG